MLRKLIPSPTLKVENTSIFAFKRFKKQILKGIIIIVAASFAGIGSAQAQDQGRLLGHSGWQCVQRH